MIQFENVLYYEVSGCDGWMLIHYAHLQLFCRLSSSSWSSLQLFYSKSLLMFMVDNDVEWKSCKIVSHWSLLNFQYWSAQLLWTVICSATTIKLHAVWLMSEYIFCSLFFPPFLIMVIYCSLCSVDLLMMFDLSGLETVLGLWNSITCYGHLLHDWLFIFSIVLILWCHCYDYVSGGGMSTFSSLHIKNWLLWTRVVKHARVETRLVSCEFWCRLLPLE